MFNYTYYFFKIIKYTGDNVKRTVFFAIIFISILSIYILNIPKGNDDNMPINNLYQQYSFYKEEHLDEYIKYQKETSLSIRQAIINVNIGLNRPFYTKTKEIINPDNNHVLVNKYNYLSSTYIPSDLIEVKAYTKANLLLKKEAYEHFIEMAKAIEKEHMQIRIVSAYRSFEYQKNLYNNYLKHDTIEMVDAYSARPGYSEHQTGLAVDIDNIQINYNKFHLTNEFTWMKENAHKYGFILRYPLGKEKITGYKYEPWHYRYVGNIAEYIYQNNLTYDEYYYEFLDKE